MNSNSQNVDKQQNTPKQTASTSFGNKGEKIAANYLSQKGYQILHTNWHWRHKEIDIVAQRNNTLVVVEVKTRTNNFWEEPKQAVNRAKQRNLIDAAEAYVNKFNINLDVQFDIVAIVWNRGSYTIEHVEDAFYPTL